MTREIVTYVSPAAGREALFEGFSPEMPSTLYDTMLKVRAHEGTEVLSTVTLPWNDPPATRYASILTDPPGIATDLPSIVFHRFGKGRVIYTAGVIESWEHDSQRAIVARLLRMLATRPYGVETDAPKSVEVTLFFLQDDRKRFVANVINDQPELPKIPIHNLKLSIRMDGRAPGTVRMLPDGAALSFTRAGDRVEFTLPVLKDFTMVEIVWG